MKSILSKFAVVEFAAVVVELVATAAAAVVVECYFGLCAVESLEFQVSRNRMHLHQLNPYSFERIHLYNSEEDLTRALSTSQSALEARNPC